LALTIDSPSADREAAPMVTQPPATQAADTAYAPAALREDFQLLRRAFEQSHPSLYRYRPKNEIDRIFDAAADRLDRPMDVVAFHRVVAPVIAAVRDGHTQVFLPESVDRSLRMSAPLPPFRFHVAGDRLFIARDLRPQVGGPGYAGLEVEAINGRAASDLIAELSAIQSGDGTIPSSRRAALRSLRFNRLYALTYGAARRYRLKLRGRRSIAVVGIPYDSLTRTLEARFPANASEPPAELAFRDGDAIAILTIRSFAGPADVAGMTPLSEFIPDAFRQITARAARALIIDVRGNGGGRDELGRILLAHLMDRPFEYYRGLFINGRDISFAAHVDRWPGPVPDTIAAPDPQGRLRLISHPNLGEHQPAEARFRGPVFILMDGESFSTTAEFLSLAHFHRRATFVGEESGGGYYGDTGGVVLTLTLPRTGMRIRLPMVRYELAVDAFSPPDRGVPPDYRIEPEIGDVPTGRDRAMEGAMSLARRH
jgi:hypothetical protein